MAKNAIKNNHSLNILPLLSKGDFEAKLLEKNLKPVPHNMPLDEAMFIYDLENKKIIKKSPVLEDELVEKLILEYN